MSKVDAGQAALVKFIDRIRELPKETFSVLEQAKDVEIELRELEIDDQEPDDERFIAYAEDFINSVYGLSTTVEKLSELAMAVIEACGLQAFQDGRYNRYLVAKSTED